MKVDARPFFKLTLAGVTARCLRPKFNTRSVGVGGSDSSSGVVDVQATHTVKVFRPLPAGLATNAVVTIDDTAPAGRYRVITVQATAAGATLYLASDPAQTSTPFVPSPTPHTPGERVPYEDS